MLQDYLSATALSQTDSWQSLPLLIFPQPIRAACNIGFIATAVVRSRVRSLLSTVSLAYTSRITPVYLLRDLLVPTFSRPGRSHTFPRQRYLKRPCGHGSPRVERHSRRQGRGGNRQRHARPGGPAGPAGLATVRFR